MTELIRSLYLFVVSFVSRSMRVSSVTDCSRLRYHTGRRHCVLRLYDTIQFFGCSDACHLSCHCVLDTVVLDRVHIDVWRGRGHLR